MAKRSGGSTVSKAVVETQGPLAQDLRTVIIG